jgi:hypothetical protein
LHFDFAVTEERYKAGGGAYDHLKPSQLTATLGGARKSHRLTRSKKGENSTRRKRLRLTRSKKVKRRASKKLRNL